MYRFKCDCACVSCLYFSIYFIFCRLAYTTLDPRQVCLSSLLSGRNVRLLHRCLSLVSHGEYTDGTDRQTDGRYTVTLRFPLDAASVINYEQFFSV